MQEIADNTGYFRRWVAKTIKEFKEHKIVVRIGSDKSGYWEIIMKY